MCWVNVCQMCVRRPAMARVPDVFVHYRSGYNSIHMLGKDANQQEVKLSTQRQDSEPEVSGVTCQAKEITASHTPTKDWPHHWTAKHTVNAELRRWCHDLTSVFIWTLRESNLIENIKCVVTSKGHDAKLQAYRTVVHKPMDDVLHLGLVKKSTSLL